MADIQSFRLRSVSRQAMRLESNDDILDAMNWVSSVAQPCEEVFGARYPILYRQRASWVLDNAWDDEALQRLDLPCWLVYSPEFNRFYPYSDEDFVRAFMPVP